MSEKRTERKPHQSIWGINPKDRIWFTTLTGIAGASLTAIIIKGNIANREPKETIEETITDIALGTAAAFAASGSGTWLILNIKDAVMSIADAIRQNTAKRREAIHNTGKEEGRKEGREEGREEGQELTIRKLMAWAEATGNPELPEQIRKFTDEIDRDSRTGKKN